MSKTPRSVKKPSHSTEPKPPTFVDLFAGCGGLSLGFEMAGWLPVLFDELNADARATYLANRPDSEHLSQDAAQAQPGIESFLESAPERLKQVWSQLAKEGRLDPDGVLDLVAGGPPCQGYSVIGHRRTFDITKKENPLNKLYLKMIDAIRLLEPRAFLFENVRGIQSGRWTPSGTKGEIFKEVLGEFEGLADYHVRHTVLFAKDFSVPQNRPRVFIVGIKKSELKALSDGRDAITGQSVSKAKAGQLPEHCRRLGRPRRWSLQ